MVDYSPINTYPCTPPGVATNIKKQKYILIPGVTTTKSTRRAYSVNVESIGIFQTVKFYPHLPISVVCPCTLFCHSPFSLYPLNKQML